MRALIDFIASSESEGDSIGELLVEEIETDWTTVTPEDVMWIQKSFQELALPNDEKIQVKIQITSGNLVVVAVQNGKFLAQTIGSNIDSFSFRTLNGSSVGFSFIKDY